MYSDTNLPHRLRDLCRREFSLAELNSNEQAVGTANLGRDAEIAQLENKQDKEMRRNNGEAIPVDTDFPKFVTHPVKIYHLLWDTATPGSTLVTDDLFALWYSSMTSTLQGKFNTFYLARGCMGVRVVVQGAAQYYGQMRLVFVPNVAIPAAESNTPSTGYCANPNTLFNSAILPHLVIDPSKNATYEIELPCPTPSGFWSLASTTYSIGWQSYRAELIQINPVRSGTAAAPTSSTGVNVCLYAYLCDPELVGLTMNSLASKEQKLSSMFSAVSGVARAVAPHVGSLGPAATLFSGATAAASQVLHFLGFANPPQLDATAMVTNRTCDNYSQVEGVSTAIVLGPSQKQGLSIDPGVALGTMEEMSIDYLCSLPFLLYYDRLITNAAGAESANMTIPVAPWFAYDAKSISPMCAFANMTSFWAGDLTYTFEFVASVFSRATIVIAWDPIASSKFSNMPALQNALNTLKTVTVQVVGNTAVDITVPYKSPYPACFTIGAPIAINNANEQSTEGYTNGVLLVYVLNPVVDNGSGVPAIAMNVWVRSHNIAFFGGSAEYISNTTINTLQMNGSEMVETTQSVMFGAKTNLDDINGVCFGDRPRSVKHLSGRLGNFTYEQPTGTAGAWVQVNYPNTPSFLCSTSSSVNPTNNNLFGYISSAYLGYRGSIRYSCHVSSTTGNRPLTMAMHSPDTISIGYKNSAVWMTMAQMVGLNYYAFTQPNLTMSSRVDFSAVMMFPGRFYPCRYSGAAWHDTVFVMATNPTGSVATGDTTTFVTANGSGDDGVFVWFLGFPRLN